MWEIDRAEVVGPNSPGEDQTARGVARSENGKYTHLCLGHVPWIRYLHTPQVDHHQFLHSGDVVVNVEVRVRVIGSIENGDGGVGLWTRSIYLYKGVEDSIPRHRDDVGLERHPPQNTSLLPLPPPRLPLTL